MQLSDKTEKVIQIIFPEEKWEYVRKIIIERLLSPYPNCGNTEQICLSALKYSKGQLDRFLIGIEEGEKDFRDLIVSAYFATDINAHIKWADQVIKENQFI
jgi:hypothetical protein